MIIVYDEFVNVYLFEGFSYYLLDQPAFLQAEVIAGDQVLCATGKNDAGFESIIVSERVQEVPMIVTKGRKGGSPVAVSIVNALLRFALVRSHTEAEA